MMNFGGGGGLSPERRAAMAQALAGGNDQWAPMRQAMMARRMGGGGGQPYQFIPPQQSVTPGTAVNGGWQTEVTGGGGNDLWNQFSGQLQKAQATNSGLSSLFSGGGQGGLLGILGSLFNKGQQPAAAPMGQAQPYMREMDAGRTRQMAMAIAGRNPGDVIAPAASGGGGFSGMFTGGGY